MTSKGSYTGISWVDIEMYEPLNDKRSRLPRRTYHGVH